MTPDQKLTAHQERCIAARPLLLQGAKQLVEKMKSPAVFLLFLTDALNWLHGYMRDMKKFNREDDHHYSLIVIIENVVVPWYAGGSEMIENITTGLNEVYDYCGAGGIRELNNSVLVGFGKFSEGMDWTLKGQREYSIAISTLVDLLETMEQYDMAVHPKDLAEAA